MTVRIPALRGPSGARPVAVAALLAAVLATWAAAPRAAAFEVQCGAEGGDAFGWAVASGGDFNGDGVDDIAIGSPCAAVGTQLRVGRVRVVSGADGAVLSTRTGSAAEELYGSAVAWIGDANGDGRDELAIGVSGHDAPKDGGGTLLAAGKVDVRSSKGGLLWSRTGTTTAALFGEVLARVPDVDGDDVPELAVGASGAQASGLAKGVAYLLSGATGDVLASAPGEEEGDLWGSLVAEAGDVDGDGAADWLSASRIGAPPDEGIDVQADETTTTTTTTTTLAPRSGRLKVYSGVPPYEELLEVFGAERVDRLGRAAATTADVDGDDLRDLWVGSPGAEPDALDDAGSITLFSAGGAVLREIHEPTPQKFSAFGTAVVVPGSLDDGDEDDVVASAPLGRVSGKAEAGRVHAFDALDGSHLWTRSGTFALERFGQSLAVGPDADDDGIADIVVGAPGSTPAGKRGAGQVMLLSGADGEILRSWAGRRGRETRLFVSGPGLGREAVVRSLDPFRRRREASFVPFPGQQAAALSMDVLNPGRRAETANGSRTLLAVGSGAGGDAARVVVYRANRRAHKVSTLEYGAGPQGYAGGVVVAAGDYTTFDDDELAVAPADATGASYPVEVFRPEFVDPVSGRITWTSVRSFDAFAPSDKVGGKTVAAEGLHLAGGDVAEISSTDLDEIVAAPAAGLPAVRVFTRTGTLVAEWAAYPSPGDGARPNSGVSVAVGDLDGEQGPEIITAPAVGQPWIRVWKGTGEPWQDQQGQTVSFFVEQYGLQYAGGLILGAADVDFDGQAEILAAPAEGGSRRILAFETTGKLVSGWSADPFGPGADLGIGLVGLDQFWKP